MKKIVSITAVKNEADIIESFIRYNLKVVDLMIILNNGSTDDTNYILDSLVKEGLPLVIIEDKDKYFEPLEKYNLLLKKAFEDYGADFVCAIDADEFLSCDSKHPRDVILSFDEYTYYRPQWKTYVPTVEDSDDKFVPARITHVRDESIEVLGKVILSKELFFEYGVELTVGNHDLEFDKKNLLNKKIFRDDNPELRIAHFPLRSIDHTTSKVLVNYPNTLSRKNISPDVSHHYPIMFYKILEEGSLDMEDVTEFAKQYSLRENKGKTKFESRDIKVFHSPMNLDFCQDIEIKYDYNIFPLGNVLKNYVYFANEIHKFKNEKEIDRINFENEMMELQNINLNLETNFKNYFLTLEDKLDRLSAYFNKNELELFKKMNIFIKLLKKDYTNLKVAVYTPNAVKDRHWGDYFFANALNESFQKAGFDSKVYERDFWYEDDCDIVVVLRGLYEYEPVSGKINVMWNISHPDDILLDEYEKYDAVFIASDKFANDINNKVDTIVKPLLQCTNPNIFYPEISNEFESEILFVGVTRGVFRQGIKDLLKTNHDFSVYGYGWEDFIDEKFIKGEFIDNDILNRAYSSCKILLNDHWEDMREKGFISNRIFDALACKTFVISDEIAAVKDLFGDIVVTYEDSNDLDKKLEYYLNNDDKRKELARKGYDLVLKNHTFDNRVFEMLSVIQRDVFYRFVNDFRNVSASMNLDEKIIEENNRSVLNNLCEGLDSFNLTDFSDNSKENVRLISENIDLNISNLLLKEKVSNLEAKLKNLDNNYDES